MTPYIPPYWLDSDVLITAKNGAFRFEIAPGFWEALEAHGNHGKVQVSKLVYEELVKDDINDDLARWLRIRRPNGFCISPDRAAQQEIQVVADYVQANYSSHHAAQFLSVADPWIIAHARSTGGTVVTHESHQPQAKKVKIPNICVALGVSYISPYEMLQGLGVKLR